MDFFSKTKPNLIDPKMKKTVYKIIKKNPLNYTISEKISEMMNKFYKSYIKQNLFFILVILAIVIFLVYRYYKKKENDKNNENFQYEFDEDAYLMNDINNQTNHLRYDTQPSFDRLHSVKYQEEPVYYPPDPLPINLSGKGIQYKRDIYNEKVNPFPYLNTPNYDYNNVYTNTSRLYHNGTYNTYNDAKDTELVNPLGYSNKFNTTTGDFIKGMTDKNEKVITDYREIIDNMEGNLIDSLKIGPKYLDVNNTELDIEPPYSE